MDHPLHVHHGSHKAVQSDLPRHGVVHHFYPRYIIILNPTPPDLDSRNDLGNTTIHYSSGFAFKIFIMFLIE